MKIIKKLGLILLSYLLYLPLYFQIGVIVTKVKHHEPIKNQTLC